jgi:hypothetical protein
MEYIIKLKIEYLHTATNNIYFIDYEISEQELYDFQSSEDPEELGFTFDRVYVIEHADPSEN